ncbi:hypothetical protein RMQ97_03055 [Maricaulis sp. D1M11]|uniref:hypothetical protein n=1 Tax=Maricaulis sp. D1M11 TaxID=3076117 RepID=UPI0039B4F191
MPREIDDKQTRKALRRLARAKRAADEADGEDKRLSDWEDDFLGSLEDRLETFGSAFNDPEKGNLDQALSSRQALKLREIEKKAKGKARKPMSRGSGFGRAKNKGLKPSTPQSRARSRDIYEDLDEREASNVPAEDKTVPDTSATRRPTPVKTNSDTPASSASAPPAPRARARFTVIPGGKTPSDES